MKVWNLTLSDWSYSTRRRRASVARETVEVRPLREVLTMAELVFDTMLCV